MLIYFMELRCNYQDLYKSKFIIWNNKEVTIIENKSTYWKHLLEKEICFVHDLLDENGKFLLLEDFQFKWNVQLGFMQYFQLLAVIPSDLKKQAFASAVPDRLNLVELDVFHLSEEKTIMLTKLRCRDYYKLFQDKMKNETIPTAVKAWSKRFLNQSQDWNKSFENIYHTTADNSHF